MDFPLGDWQFWTVTTCAVGAVWLLVKPFVGRSNAPSGSCSSCPKSTLAASGPDANSRGRDELVTIGKARG
jgi:hypothetical protein